MTIRTIKAANGEELTLSSDDLDSTDLAVAEVLIEIAGETGAEGFAVDEEEILRRLEAKGIRLNDGPLH